MLQEPGRVFTKNEFVDMIHEINPQYSEQSVYWLLRKLWQENQIQKLGKIFLKLFAGKNRNCPIPMSTQMEGA